MTRTFGKRDGDSKKKEAKCNMKKKMEEGTNGGIYLEAAAVARIVSVKKLIRYTAVRLALFEPT